MPSWPSVGRVLLVAGVAGSCWPRWGAAQLTQGEALRLAFPPPVAVERRTAFLSEADLAKAKALAGDEAEVTSRVVTYYVGVQDGRAVGAAYFDRHRVRTLDEVVMIVVVPGDRVERVELVEFREPPEYRAPAGWLKQFGGRKLDQDLSLRGSVAAITGATLTSRAVVRSLRRVLALHQVIAPFGQSPPR